MRWGRVGGVFQWLVIGALAISVLVPISALGGATEPRAPAQPTTGPGGSSIRFARVVHRKLGEQPTGGWLFLPANPDGSVPVTEPLPLVLFFHGYTALNPTTYLSWINHLALNGAAVFYPDYQNENFGVQNPDNYLPQALRGVRLLMDQVGTGDLPPVDTDRVTAVGHSLGGVLAANYTAIAADHGVPVPGVLMPVEPGGCTGCGDTGDRLGAPVINLGAIPATVLALVIAGEDDTVVEDIAAKVIWDRLQHLPRDQRDFVVFQSDSHGQPPLIADHLMPQTSGAFSERDAFDYHGLWKLLDGLMACAFNGEWCDVALGGTDAQRSLGNWSDGTPVAPLLVTDNPS